MLMELKKQYPLVLLSTQILVQEATERTTVSIRRACRSQVKPQVHMNRKLATLLALETKRYPMT